jgi:LmbE family N-acetylglucosaminyl deacetylase
MQDISPLVLFSRKVSRLTIHFLARSAKRPWFKRSYAIAAVLILLATTIFWALLGARLQSHNADQLSDPYLFTNWQTFHGAFFPGSHTFLLKWPIFALLGLIGISSTTLLFATVTITVLTVAIFALILYKIDGRPLVFGTVCLGLALVLLLIPAQAYSGGLLPVNMAMLTTRNLEYVVYLGTLIVFARANRMLSLNFMFGVVLLTVLIASDKLFLSMSAGGALLALVAYALVGNWSLTTFAVKWLTGTIFAAIGSVGLLLTISSLHITHLASTATSPYSIIHDAKHFLLGTVYSVLGLFTNSGANPVYDNRVISQLPGSLVHRLWSLTGLCYGVTICLVVYAVLRTWQHLWPTLRATPRQAKQTTADLLALALIWSTMASFAVFIVTDHYYAVDARYLAISMFALVITISVSLRRRQWPWPEDLLLIGGIFILAIGFAVVMATRIASNQTAALDGLTARNSLVVAALERHRVDVLVGDYWRVLPIKLASQGSLTTKPLINCSQSTPTLTSTTWQPDIRLHSFAYLITLDGSLTNFPACSFAQVTAVYGHPNATQIIAGTLTKPTEALLFYDQGIRPHNAVTYSSMPPVLPVGLDKIAGNSCTQQTTMNIVAHQDDDLLFLSPDLLHEIRAGQCVRSIYLTAGDAGHDKFYWLSRQSGTEAAYNEMIGTKAIWDQQTVTLAPDEYVTIASPHDNPRISLIFFNLPDGNLVGQGFPVSRFESLAKLRQGTIPNVRTVDAQSIYTSQGLTTALTMLMNVYQPSAIHTQADVQSDLYPDHSDHITTGLFAQAASDQYSQQHFGGALSLPLTRYIGYPTHAYTANVVGSDLAQKEAAFLAYGEHDGGVCHTLQQCDGTATYGTYMSRQYTQDSTLR